MEDANGKPAAATPKRPVAVTPAEADLIVSPEARLPTEHGNFRAIAFTDPADGKEHLAIISGKVEGEHGVLIRMHSECLTGDVLGSMRCDCGPQLDLALKRIAEEGGIVLYLRQEGRGIGLANKMAAYQLQDDGRDTVDANTELGLPADARCYTIAARILHHLEVQCVRVMTNNPAKVEALKRKGIHIVAREAHEIPANDENRFYLTTKRDRMQHYLQEA